MQTQVEQPVVTVVLDRRLKPENPGRVLEKARPLPREGFSYLTPNYLQGTQELKVDEVPDDP